MDSLKCEFEEVVKELNEKYPNQKKLKFNGHNGDSSGGQWSIKLGDDDSNPVCYISYSKVRGHYSLEKDLTYWNRKETSHDTNRNQWHHPHRCCISSIKTIQEGEHSWMEATLEKAIDLALALILRT